MYHREMIRKYKENKYLGYGRMPRALAPLIAALIQYGIPALVSLGSAAIGSSATSSANDKNIAAANKANAVTNQQWGAEMGERKKEFGQTEIDQFNAYLKKDQGLGKNLIGIWGGGR